MEDKIFRARRMPEDGKNSGDGASKVSGVKCHGYVDSVMATFDIVLERRRFGELCDVDRGGDGGGGSGEEEEQACCEKGDEHAGDGGRSS